MAKLRTHKEARAWLEKQGVSISQWSRDHNVGDSLVREILNGKKKCRFGMSHNIAVLLGMKEGTLTTRPGRTSTRSTEQSGAAA